MAQQIEFQPHIDPMPSGRDELEDLIETLHESGTFRVLNGLFGKLGEVSKVAMEGLASPEGQHAIANASLLIMAFGRLHPDDLRAVIEATEKGMGAAAKSLQDDPPNTLRLLFEMRDPDVRRAIHAGLTMLHHIGKALPRKMEEEESSEP